jgi:hypothetical protein
LTSLTGVVYELARFAHFAYLPFYALVARAIYVLAMRTTEHWLRWVVLGVFCWLVSLNVGHRMTLFAWEQLVFLAVLYIPLVVRIWPHLIRLEQPLFLPPLRGVGVAVSVAAVTCMAVLGFFAANSLSFFDGAVLAGILLGLVVFIAFQCGDWYGWVSALPVTLVPLACLVVVVPRLEATSFKGAVGPAYFALQLPRFQRTAWAAPPVDRQYLLTPEFLELTHWVRDNTPPDSLFHLTHSDFSFRCYAERAVLMCRSEWGYGLYAGTDPKTMQDLWNDLCQLRGQPRLLVEKCKQHGVRFIVAPKQEQPCLPLQRVFENSDYTVYQIGAPHGDQEPKGHKGCR